MQTVDWGKQHVKRFLIHVIHNRINIDISLLTPLLFYQLEVRQSRQRELVMSEPLVGW